MNLERKNKMNIYFGDITMTHGLKGELKCFTNFEQKDKVLEKDFPIYIDNKLHHITSVRPFKNCYLITIDNLYDINLVEPFRHKKIYIKREDLALKKDEYLLQDLIGYQVVENDERMGNVSDIQISGTNILLKVKGKKTFYIPWQPNFILKVDPNQHMIYGKNIEELII